MLQVGDRVVGTRAAAAAVALAQGVQLAREAAPYVEEAVTTVRRAYDSLRDYSRVRYGPGPLSEERIIKRARREERKKAAQEVKKQLFKDIEKKAMSNSVQIVRSFDRMGRKRRRTAKEIFTANIGRMSEVIFRWQRCSPSLLGPGQTDIVYGQDVNVLDTGRVLPIHIMSLTNLILFPSDQQFGCQRDGLHRITYDTGTKQFGYQKLICQDNLGNQTGLTEWQYEDGNVRNLSAAINPSVFHKWTEIRLNLYGSGAMPLTYEILVLTAMPSEMSVFDFSPGGAPIIEEANLNAFLRDQSKDYIGNPIIGSSLDRTDYKSKFRVLRRKVVRIDPLSYGDFKAQIDGGSSLGASIDITNVRNINMFIRHDRFRNYAWTPQITDETLQSDLGWVGFDKSHTSVTAQNIGISDVDRDQRVYLMIKCTAARPLLGDNAIYDIEPDTAPVGVLEPNAIPPYSGSYDVVVRNCFRYDDAV